VFALSFATNQAHLVHEQVRVLKGLSVDLPPLFPQPGGGLGRRDGFSSFSSARDWSDCRRRIFLLIHSRRRPKSVLAHIWKRVWTRTGSAPSAPAKLRAAGMPSSL
jgi:hypothetical protein